MRPVLLLISFVIFNFQFSIFPACAGKNSQVYAADTSPPLTQGRLDPENPDGSNGWYKSPVTVTLLATDLDSGVKTINWKLDSGAWNSTEFTGTLNLVQNPSFETTVSGQVSNWSFTGMPSSTGVSDSVVHQFGSRSIRINSYENGWSGFNNQVSYIPATPFANMTASVWVKTQSVYGTGALFKIYALTPSGPLHLVDSPAVSAAPYRGYAHADRAGRTAFGITRDHP